MPQNTNKKNKALHLLIRLKDYGYSVKNQHQNEALRRENLTRAFQHLTRRNSEMIITGGLIYSLLNLTRFYKNKPEILKAIDEDIKWLSSTGNFVNDPSKILDVIENAEDTPSLINPESDTEDEGDDADSDHSEVD